MSKICPVCGKSNINGVKFCEECGEPLEDKPINTRPLFIGILAIILIFAIVVDVAEIIPRNNGSYQVGENYTYKINVNSTDPNYQIFNNSFLTFQLPSNWTVMQSSTINRVIELDTNGNQDYHYVRIGVYNSSDSPINYTAFTLSDKAGDTEYKYMQDGDSICFVVRKDGKDLQIIGQIQDEAGMKMILKTFKFK